MGDFFRKLLFSYFLPHGHNYFLRPSLLWLNVISDSLIALAFFSIPFTLNYFTRKRSGSKLRGPTLIFALFMFACGTTHLLAVWNTWNSAYRLEVLVKAIASIICVTTAILAIRLAPMALKIATPKELALVYDSLSGEIESRRAAEEKLRRHVELQLLASDDKLLSFFEASSQAILGVSGNGDISLINRRTEEMFGYPRAELLGQKLELLMPERFSSAHVAHRDGYFDTPHGRPIGAGMYLAGLRKNGTEFPIEVGLSHVNTPEGPIVFALVSDISARINGADELKGVNETLRQSNVEIEQFARIASHDLQEPLRMVTNYLQLIERRYTTLLDDDGRDFIRFAVDGATRMRALIEGLLDLSRAGTSAANLCAVPADSVLQNALANLKATIDESGARITAATLPSIVADPILLTQVFQNLIGNAIKFQKDNKPCVHISSQHHAGEWIFSVQDNGIGIDARHFDQIFKIFERLHNAEEFSGSGIGLAVTRKIVERHGGKVWVESQPGTGSTFYFSIAAETALASAANPGLRS